MKSSSIVAIVLAGQEGCAWSVERLLVPISGVPVLARIAGALAASGIDQMILVGDPGCAAAARACGMGFLASDTAASSLVESVRGRIVVALCADLPLLTSATVTAFVSAVLDGSTVRLVEASGALAAFRTADDALAAVRGALARGDCRGLAGDEGTWRAADAEDMERLSSPATVAPIDRVARRRRLAQLSADGVLIFDGERTVVDDSAHVGRGSVLLPGVFVKGSTVIGENCRIGPDAWITDSRIGDSSVVWYSVVEQAVVGVGVQVGPFAHLRKGADVGAQARIGNFVEVKASRLGRGTKASHLAYIGDADIGENVNVGAGTITCNYDGAAKHRTVVEDGVFIGSNTSIVAPVTIGRGASVGAGSTITEDVPAGALAIARARQVNKERKGAPPEENR